METVAIEITDPAKELTTLCEFLQGTSGGTNTLDALSKCIGISPEVPELLEVLAALQQRVKELTLLVNEISDSVLDKELKSEVLSSAGNFAQVFHPRNLQTPWDQIRRNFLPERNVQALRFFSQTARRYRPLRVVPAKARDEALVEIAKIILEVRADRDLEEWMRPILIEGLNRIQLVLRHFPFFGHEQTIIELFLAHQKFLVVRDALENANSKSASFWKALATFGILGNLFILPNEAVTAFDRYKTWTAPFLRQITDSQLPLNQRLLPPPTAVLRDTEEETPASGKK